MTERFRPPDLDPTRIVARLGLISDTHLPDRWPALPAAIDEVFAGVDLILHAGDVGELRVLDSLSRNAPVIAVHGNDDTAESQAALPFQQLLTIAGHRILLSHSHHPDRATDLASRVGDEWAPRLAANAARAHAHGATIYVSGHLHIPYISHTAGVWLVNPGAIASGSLITRQHIQTVALLYLQDDGRPFVVHVDITGEPRLHDAYVDWEAGFDAAHRRYETSILAPDLIPFAAAVRRSRFFDDPRARELMTALGRRVWAGERAQITVEDVRAAITNDRTLSAAERVELLAVLNDTTGRTT